MAEIHELVTNITSSDTSEIVTNITGSDESEVEVNQKTQVGIQNKSQNSDIRLLCLTWNLEVIKQKGFHPKFLINFVIVCFLLLLCFDTFVYGYGTDWNLFVFVPTTIARTATGLEALYKLGKTQQELKNLEKSKINTLCQLTIMTLGMGGVLCAIIIKTPFNNPAFYLMAVYPSFFIVTIFVTLIQDKKEVPLWLPQQKQPIYATQTKNFKFSKKNDNSKDEYQIYKLMAWASFVLSTMFIDVCSDIYFGVDLIIFYHAKSVILLVFGIAVLICCLADLIFVSVLLLFPTWMSYSSHLIAFVMEIPNIILTGISVWKINQLGKFVEQSEVVWSLAIFSLVTTLLAALIHIMYIIDQWNVYYAMKQLQENF